jgi:hypothetical protein
MYLFSAYESSYFVIPPETHLLRAAASFRRWAEELIEYGQSPVWE